MCCIPVILQLIIVNRILFISPLFVIVATAPLPGVHYPKYYLAPGLLCDKLLNNIHLTKLGNPCILYIWKLDFDAGSQDQVIKLEPPQVPLC